MRGNTESGNVVSSHSSAWGASSLVAKLRIDSRSCSCSSVKMKCLRCALEVGLAARSRRWPCGVSIGAALASVRRRSRASVAKLIGTLTHESAKVNSRDCSLPAGSLIQVRMRPCPPRRFSTTVDDDGVATITLNDPDTRNALSAELLGGLIEAFERAREERGALRGARLLARAAPSPRAPTSAASPPTTALVHKHFGSERFVGAVQAHRRAGQADRLRGAWARARGRARHRARLRSDRRLRGGQLRHARDQHRHLPLHDHGAHLSQRAAQEGQRAAAARRALERAGGARRRHRQQGRPRRGARRARGRLGRQAGREVARDHAPRQGGHAPPAGHGAR